MDYGFMQDPHLPPASPQQRPLTVLTMLETTTGLSNAILTPRKGDTTHQRQQIKKWITTNGFANSILQTDSEAAILQLGENVSRELGLRFRASPPHSHQSNGAVERLHRTLFDQLRAVRLQWALSLGIQPERLPQQSLPWLLQHSVFILNKYLVKDTGTTAHQNNYHKTHNNPICQFGEAVLADTRYLVNYKLRQRNLEQKIKGIWIGKDPTTDEHLIALPPIYDNHPSVTGSIYTSAEVSLDYLDRICGTLRSLLLSTGHLWRAWTTLSLMSLRTTSTYKSTTQAPENNLHINHHSSNQFENNHNNNDHVEK